MGQELGSEGIEVGFGVRNGDFRVRSLGFGAINLGLEIINGNLG